jgi:sugar phosphate isomerase/epimerase
MSVPVAPRHPMKTRPYSLSYLTAHRCTAVEAARIAAAEGFTYFGLRPRPNLPGGAFQALIDDPVMQRELKAVMRDTGLRLFDLEIIRIDADFDPHRWDALMGIGREMGAHTIVVAGDDTDEARLAQHYGQVCEALRAHGLTGDLEFMPWTGVPDAKAAMRVIRAAGQPANAGILVDALHVDRSTTSLDDIRAIPRELLHFAQICDAPAGKNLTTEQLIHTARCERLLPGEGDIDLAALFAALPDDLPVSVEVIHLEREKTMAPRAWAAACLAATRPFFEAA